MLSRKFDVSWGGALRIFTAALLTMTTTGAFAEEITGAKVMEIFQYCSQEAEKKCGRNSIRCEAYRKSYVKACMIQIGVAPDYIDLLVNQ